MDSSKKKSSDRFDWTQFLSHPYLQRNEPTSKQAWLQHVYVFFPQGSIITLYVKPAILISAMKGALQNLTGVSINEQILLDNEGQVLQDNLSLEAYRFDQIEKPIYCIFWPILRGEEMPQPPLQFKYEIPHPVAQTTYSDLSIKFPMNSIPDTQRARDFLQRIETELHNRSKNLKARLENVKTFNFQHDYQQEVYKIIRSHIFRVGNDLQQEQRAVLDIYDSTQANVISIIAVYVQMIDELRRTVIHPSLEKYLKANNLLQLVDEKKVAGYFQIMQAEYESLKKNTTSLKHDIALIREEIDRIESTKLDDSSLKELQGTVTALGSILAEAKNLVTSFHDSLKITSQRINDMLSLPHLRHDATIQEITKTYTDNMRISTEFFKLDDKSISIIEQAQRVKMACTREMLKNFGPIGRVIVNSQNIFKLSATIRSSISKIHPIIVEMNNISKLSSVYKNYVNEIIYRKSFDDRSKKLNLSFQNQIQKELQTENVRRNAFQELHGVSIYLKPLAHLLSKLPLSPTITTPPEDIVLPDLGVVSTLEDEFCFVEEGTTEEKLKRIEKEKGELAVALAAVTKELALSKKPLKIKRNSYLLMLLTPNL